MKLLRLNWAKRHEKWNEEDWRKVIFSDESKFNLHGPDGRDYVRRRSGEAFHPDCLRSTVKYPAGQMVWGCFSYFGIGHLYFIDSTVKAKNYIDILKHNLLPTIRNQFGGPENCLFQDDSAPCHRAKIVSQKLYFLYLYYFGSHKI